MVGDLKSEVVIGERIKKSTYSKRDQFAPELSYFSDCVLKGRDPEPGGVEGLSDVRIINALLESQKSGRAVKLETLDVGKRPGVDQEIRKPPAPKPELVHAQAPSA
jgi:glucose-fructose oxidoreductase